MKVKSLLLLAAKCKDKIDLENLLWKFEQAVLTHKRFEHIDVVNEQLEMEPTGPYVHFELNHVISNEYVLMIRPEIRERALTVVVRMNRMLDKRGLSSKSFEPVEGMDELVEAKESESISSICEKIVNLATQHHQRLIESVGVPSVIAEQMAKAPW